MKTCTKCVTPETAESLKFDKDGSCSVCSQINYKRDVVNWNERKVELDRIIKNFKDKGSYDCIVPFSGGKDLLSHYGIL